jgi:hypothetical protein
VSKGEETSLDETGFGFVVSCIGELEARGLEEQGLYRLVGVSSKVSKLLSLGLERRKGVGGSSSEFCLTDRCEWETKTITSALKTYFRNLPEPLMTFRYHEAFIAAASKWGGKSLIAMQVLFFLLSLSVCVFRARQQSTKAGGRAHVGASTAASKPKDSRDPHCSPAEV